MLSIFNYSVKKLSYLESSFSNSDTCWKNKTCIISTKTLRIEIYLSKTFLQTQSFFIVWNQKQMIFVLEKTGSKDRKLLNLKGLANFLPTIQKLYQIPYILCNPLSSLFAQSAGTNLLAPRGTLGLQCICRAQLFIQMTHLHCRLPCNYIKSLLAYCRGQKRITTYIYCIKLQLRYF